MPKPASTLLFETIPEAGLLISYQTTATPRDDEWEAYLTACKELLASHPKPCFLVVTHGGHPSRQQQARVKAELGYRTSPVAIISKATIARFVASIMALMNPAIQCFAPEQRDQAFSHLHLDAAQRKLVLASLDRMTKKLGESSAAA
ncbi:MAG TPA: hypothetical protein VFQ61_08370 [Polyangiaceae bacterium]|nr:hypothetical protein [Polyangiaceae bacterium]